MNRDLRVTITEDGEAMGTLSQFADRVNRSRSFVLRWVHDRAPRAIVLNAGEGRERLLILAPNEFKRLLRCTRRRPHHQKEAGVLLDA